MTNEICPVCQNELSLGYQAWHFICNGCDYEKANFQQTINAELAHLLINENARETGLKELRLNNFKKLLADIKSIKPAGGRLLDVGCAHGWFLETARNDFDAHGIEPDKHIFAATSKNGLPIRMGYFPDALDDSETFDVITFNDVIEHIPDIQNILVTCHKRLNKDGLLVLNVPSSNGVFYKLSNLCCRLGVNKFFERLWQKDLPSPHLHYFNPLNIKTLLKYNGFDVKITGTLPTIGLSGLYTRISYTGNLSLISRILIYIGVAISLPILKILPRDVVYVVSSKK